VQDLIAYRLERARDALVEARVMQDIGHPNACVNRIYYACFYAVSALLVAHGYSSAKHSGVRSLFGRHFVNTGLIARDLGRFYSHLFESRQESDYVDFVRVDSDELAPMFEVAARFIAAVEALIPEAPSSG